MLFWTKKQVTKPGKKKTQEAPSLAQQMEDAVAKQLNKNPELKTRYAIKTKAPELYQELYPKPKTAEEEAAAKLEKVGYQQLEQMAETDEDFRQRLAERAVDKLFGGKGGSNMHIRSRDYSEFDPDNYDPRHGPSPEDSSPARQILEQMQDIEDLKTQLGVKTEGPLAFFKDPEVLKTALDLIGSLIPGRGLPRTAQLASQPPLVYIVNVDGQKKGLTEEDYKRLDAEGRLQPLALLKPMATTPSEIPPTTAPAGSPETESQPPNESENSQPPAVNWADLTAHMKLSPRQFVEHLVCLSRTSQPIYGALLVMLQQADYKDLVEAFQQEGLAPEAREAADFITAPGNKKLVMEMLRLVKKKP